MKKRSEKMEIVTVTNTQDMFSKPKTLTLLSDIRSLLEAAQRRVSTTANVEMVLLYWHIGNRILKDILGNERADYGKQIVQTLSVKLILEYGRGYSRTNLFYMIRFAEVFELKLGKFQAQDKGQMELYLRWLDRYEKRTGEESPLGLILCAEKTTEHVELLQLETSGIRVAEYLTELPPRPLLEAKLHEAIRLAREQIVAHEVPKLEGEK